MYLEYSGTQQIRKIPQDSVHISESPTLVSKINATSGKLRFFQGKCVYRLGGFGLKGHVQLSLSSPVLKSGSEIKI